MSEAPTGAPSIQLTAADRIDAAAVEVTPGGGRVPWKLWLAMITLVVFSACCLEVALSVRSLRGRLERRVGWLISLQQLLEGLGEGEGAAPAEAERDFARLTAEIAADPPMTEALEAHLGVAQGTVERRVLVAACRQRVGAIRGETALISRRLGRRWGQVNALLGLAVALAGWTLALTFVAHRRRREAEQWQLRLARANVDLSRAAREAHAASELTTRFLANVSHEVRTPMTAILGHAGLLAMREQVTTPDSERLAALQTIRRSGEHLLRVLDDILDISGIESGKLKLQPQSVSVPELVDELRQLLEPLAAQQSNTLEVVCGPGVGPMRTDPTRLRQVLLNLLNNANKFTAGGALQLTVEVDGDRIRFVVSDTGIGISPAQRERLFKPFVQGDGSASRRYGGTGLGLAISQRLAALLGGRISVESKEGEGSTFTVDLPVEMQLS